MSDFVDKFWELFKSVAGGTGTGITDVQNSLAKANRTKVEDYFTEVIDQVSFGTIDYNRLRRFFVDLFATHRTLSNLSINATDPHSLSNSDLDELFRSFGYPHSSQLRDFDENPLEQKIQFFLDLVNLYKVKGTPQSLVDVLQYYGVTEVDIYEFLLKLDRPGELIFDGKVVAGTSINPTMLQIPFTNLTALDPHWIYTADQILTLNSQLKINLPSQTPYIGVQPVVDLDGVEFSLIARIVQDQYASWKATGVLPTANAEITFVGEVKSFLELYLSTIYMFNQIYPTGVQQDTFLCYDGTSTDYVQILEDFETLTSPPIRRCDLNDNVYPMANPCDWIVDSTSGLCIPSSYCTDSKLVEFYDTFTRPAWPDPSTTNFLRNINSAGHVLGLIDPTLKAELDSSGQPEEVLYSLLKDMANWVRANLGLGFVNFGFILFGINEFFKDLKPVIEFFKPYHARLLLIEALQIKNRLFNTIKVTDEMSFNFNFDFHDFMTGDSIPCCVEGQSIDSTSGTCVGVEHTTCNRKIAGDIEDTNWQGYWVNNTQYSIDDLVACGSEGNYYICTQAHQGTYETKPGFGPDWSSFWNLYSYLECADSTASGASVATHSRDFYDCGSYHDIGAVTDLPQELFIEVSQDQHDPLRCPIDGTSITGIVTSDLISSSDSTTFIDATAVINTAQGGIVVSMLDLLSDLNNPFDFYQSGAMRNFDDDGTFDCTHGFDLVNVSADTDLAYLLQENGAYLLQEDGGKIIL